MRKSSTHFCVPNSNIIIEKDTIVLIPVDAIHNDPEIFSEPERFEPERFSSEELQRLNPCAFLPFGDGKRVCIGVGLAKLICKIGLVMLLGRFKFKVSKSFETIEKKEIGFTRFVNGGISLEIERL